MDETRIDVGTVVRTWRGEELHMIYTHMSCSTKRGVVYMIKVIVTYRQYYYTCFSPSRC